MKDFFELREGRQVDISEAVSKVKTTMPDKVASSATRFGLKAKTQGGHVSISGPKGKLNDFLRAIIGRSSYGNASELSESVEMSEETALAYQTPYGTATAYKRDTKGMRGKQDGYKLTIKTKSGKTVDLGSHPNPTKANVLSIVKNVMQKESVEEAYRKPTAAEIAADKAKERRASGSKGPDSSARYKNIKKKMYGNAMGGLKKEENDLEEQKYAVKYTHPTDKKSGKTTGPLSKAAAEKKAAMGNRVDKVGGKYTVIRHVGESVQEVDEAKLSAMGIHNKIADRNLLIKAIKTAEKMGGNMTGAVREIEKMKKGLSKHKAVQAALRQANESVRSADKKPQNFRDPETGKTKVRMVPVDRDISSRKVNESVEK